MPNSKNYKRNYRQEYDRYQGKPEQKKRRAKRNAARRSLMREGRVKLGDGMDVDHKNTNPNDNSKKNLRVQKKGTNRSFPRNKKAGKK
ncbi:MAG: HNH endonuclease [Chromatiaceae bacterium]|nr:HNH endonuclease [Chromatiaceae bacterium]